MVSFTSPPINEVVIGKKFSPVAQMLLPHYGRFWDLVQEDFPTCQHAAPVSDSPTAPPPIDAETQAPLPRVYFNGRDATRLLQLQSDRFYFNWRQTTDREQYVRFEKVFEEYLRYEKLFDLFVTTQFNTALSEERYELTYVNVMDQGKEWQDVYDLPNLFAGIGFLKDSRSMGKVIRGAYQTEYELPADQGRLTVRLTPGLNVTTQTTVARLELSARSVAGLSRSRSEAWFSAAHSAIVEGFCELTTKEAQDKFWKRTS